MILVEIENFQSISKASLRIDGFTTVVGRSNIGKSSIVRALKCALTGSLGSNFVRHDPKTCGRILRKTKKCKCFSSVKMSFDGDPVILWEKGDSINRYTVWSAGAPEKIYDRVGPSSDLPDFVETKFAPVKLGSSSDGILQVSDQFDPIFLLNLGGTTVADILSDLGQLETINKASSLVSKDRVSAGSTRKIRERDLAATTTRLASYESLDSDLSRVKALQIALTTAREKEARRDLVVRLYDEARLALQDARLLKKALEPELPSRTSLEAPRDRWLQVVRFSEDLQSHQTACSELKGVSSVNLPDIDPLFGALEALARCEKWLGQLRVIRETFQRFKSFGESTSCQTSPEEMEGQLRKLRVVARYERLQASLESQIAEVEDELLEVEQEEASVLRGFEELGACPSCHQQISPGHLHG